MKFSLNLQGVQMKKTIIAISFLTFSSVSQAAFNVLSIHSRNNCGNNESISWDGTQTHHLKTLSKHFRPNTSYHDILVGPEQTWRSAAVHWGEGTGGWTHTKGEHTLFENGNTKVIWVKYTDVKDCSIYDGWWEANPPEGVSK
jgi:hypothetical protein